MYAIDFCSASKLACYTPKLCSRQNKAVRLTIKKKKSDSQPLDYLLNTDSKKAVTGQKANLYFRH